MGTRALGNEHRERKKNKRTEKGNNFSSHLFPIPKRVSRGTDARKSGIVDSANKIRRNIQITCNFGGKQTNEGGGRELKSRNRF